MMYKKVIKVKPIKEYNIIVTFEDGKTVLFDVKKIYNKGEFRKLKDEKFMKKVCRVMNNTLAFDINETNNEEDCFDIAPDVLYKLNDMRKTTSHLYGMNMKKEKNMKLIKEDDWL